MNGNKAREGRNMDMIGNVFEGVLFVASLIVLACIMGFCGGVLVLAVAS
jgi:hypothetical protein